MSEASAQWMSCPPSTQTARGTTALIASGVHKPKPERGRAHATCKEACDLILDVQEVRDGLAKVDKGIDDLKKAFDRANRNGRKL